MTRVLVPDLALHKRAPHLSELLISNLTMKDSRSDVDRVSMISNCEAGS